MTRNWRGEITTTPRNIYIYIYIMYIGIHHYSCVSVMYKTYAMCTKWDVSKYATEERKEAEGIDAYHNK